MIELTNQKRTQRVHPSLTTGLNPQTQTQMTYNQTIKTWAIQDRPREKLLQTGQRNLSDAELLAIILGSGSKNETAVALAKRILHAVDNNLHVLGKSTLSDFQKFKGIGEVKAITIAAALELGRRRQYSIPEKKVKITSSDDAFRMMAPTLADLNHEEFWVLFLNRSNIVMKKERISIGGISGTVVDARIIFKKAMDLLASSIILIHNHPSGNLNPSKADITITKKLKEGGKLLDISVLDHLIVTDGGFYSFADEGIF